MRGEMTCAASRVVRVLERALAEKSCAGMKDWRAIADAWGYPHVNAMRRSLAQLKPFGDLDVWFPIDDAETVQTSNPDAYGCECGREFSTRSGLGLHRASSKAHRTPVKETA